MTVEEFIVIDSDKVRRSPSLISFYTELFFKTFGYKPSCSSCSFSTDYYKLKTELSLKKEKNFVDLSINNEVQLKLNNMKVDVFKLKQIKHQILVYKKDGKVHRLYDHLLTDEFVKGFLTFGTPEQIEERKKLFKILPSFVSEEVPVEEIPVSDATIVNNEQNTGLTIDDNITKGNTEPVKEENPSEEAKTTEKEDIKQIPAPTVKTRKPRVKKAETTKVTRKKKNT